MSQNQAQVIQQMHDLVVAKSLKDPAFRAAFIANPRATVEKEFNTALPATIKLNVIESPANTMTIVLPHVSAVAADGELSDSDLEAVAGGGKSDWEAPFVTVGNLIADNPLTVGSAVGGAVLGAVASLGCTAARVTTGQK